MIGVIARHKDFIRFIQDFEGRDSEGFVLINNLNAVRGLHLTKVIRIGLWYEIMYHHQIYMEALISVKRSEMSNCYKEECYEIPAVKVREIYIAMCDAHTRLEKGNMHLEECIKDLSKRFDLNLPSWMT